MKFKIERKNNYKFEITVKKSFYYFFKAELEVIQYFCYFVWPWALTIYCFLLYKFFSILIEFIFKDFFLVFNFLILQLFWIFLQS